MATSYAMESITFGVIFLEMANGKYTYWSRGLEYDQMVFSFSVLSEKIDNTLIDHNIIVHKNNTSHLFL